MFTCSLWNLSVPQSNSWKRLAASLVQSVYYRFDYGSLGRGPQQPAWLRRSRVRPRNARGEITPMRQKHKGSIVSTLRVWRRAEHCEEQSSKQTAPKWPLSLHRYRGLERRPPAGRTPAEHRRGNVIKVENTHLLETHWDVSQVSAECWWGAATFIDVKRGHNKGITYYYLIMGPFIKGLLLSSTCSPGEKGHVADVTLTTTHAIMETWKLSALREERMGGAADLHFWN